ncbi:uncharacterized protein LOC106642776 [Copidosoma floridanum]|uniref:uncharacterized protein LOC106642776 n=1 Tax=Copidosoma floridanum TaxID=29053 RepID=UPI0006C952E7|nr:uncharacterized protein LOC106642776 [Copidosoma floridanum]
MTQFPSLGEPMSMQTCDQPMPTKPIGQFSQQMGGTFGVQHQPFQQAPAAPNNPQGTPYYAYYPQTNAPSQMMPGYGPTLPQNIIEHLRACGLQSASPIFILPSQQPNPMATCQPIPAPTCIPYPMPMAIYPPCGQPQQQKAPGHECKCSNGRDRSSHSTNELNDSWEKSHGGGFSLKNEGNSDSWSRHQCQETTDGTMCARKNCPATIQLQAMISQMLGVQGTVSAAVTRLLLRQIPGANVKESLDEVMAVATRCLKQMTKEQLLRESKSCQQLNSLLGLFLTAQSTLARVIPVLTTAQLKTNLLKALVEGLINAKIAENQGCGAEAPEQLDPLLLELKSDDEVRELLATLREKECEERCNLSFAANNAQRLISESRLANVQRKIQQLDREMRRRRDGNEYTDWSRSVGVLQRHSSSVPLPERYDSPDPFVAYRVASPKRLILKPHVGSPETTYRKPDESATVCSKQRVGEAAASGNKESGAGEDSGEANESECQCRMRDCEEVAKGPGGPDSADNADMTDVEEYEDGSNDK